MDTHNRAHPASIAVSANGEEHHPEYWPETSIQREEVDNQLFHRHEVTNEGKASDKGYGKPRQMLEGFSYC
ncbi:hypothetical protein AND4_16914 [Vibrio sp. AND4]|nr:hypothetical protein AND4_16914 [Vibrio sp. AND4]